MNGVEAALAGNGAPDGLRVGVEGAGERAGQGLGVSRLELRDQVGITGEAGLAVESAGRERRARRWREGP